MNRMSGLLAVLVLLCFYRLATADPSPTIFFGKGSYEFAEERRAFGKAALTNTTLRGRAARDLNAQAPRSSHTLRLSSIFLTHKTPENFHLGQTRVAHGRTLLFSNRRSLATPHEFSSMAIEILSLRGTLAKSVELDQADLWLEPLANGKARLFIQPDAVKRLKDFVESLPQDANALRLVITERQSNAPFVLPLQFRDLNRKAFYFSPGRDCESNLAAEGIERDLTQLGSELGD